MSAGEWVDYVTSRCNSLCTLSYRTTELQLVSTHRYSSPTQSPTPLRAGSKQFCAFPLKPLPFIPQHANLASLRHRQVLPPLEVVLKFAPNLFLLATQKGVGISRCGGEGWAEGGLELLQPCARMQELGGFGGDERFGALDERVDLGTERGGVLVSPLCDGGFGED